MSLLFCLSFGFVAQFHVSLCEFIYAKYFVMVHVQLFVHDFPFFGGQSANTIISGFGKHLVSVPFLFIFLTLHIFVITLYW